MTRPAVLVLGAMILFAFLFLHLPLAIADPFVGFKWTNPCKALAMLGGVILLAGSLPPDAARFSRLRKLSFLGTLLLAEFLILGGIQHFVYADFVAQLVPAWIPSRHFWVYFTGVALIAGGVGMLVPKTAAGRLGGASPRRPNLLNSCPGSRRTCRSLRPWPSRSLRLRTCSTAPQAERRRSPR